MNTAELAEKVAAEHDLGKGHAKQVVQSVLNAIIETAAGGEEVALSGFGKFRITSRAAREGRNPRTGEAVSIAASKKLAFAAAKPVRDRLNAPTKKGKGKAAAKAPAKKK